MLKINRIYNMDCIEGMKQLDDNSVDAVVTDPPYGLEFMGKDWDKFEPERNRWKDKSERKLIGDGSGQGSDDFGERFNEMPKSIPKKNKKCKKCGHYAFSGTPCKCETSEWEIDNSYINHFQEFTLKWATECFRVLKPGGHLLSFGGTRTYHRMACAIEDAGFSIRDMLEWVYGSGFPKSHNIGKSVDKLLGNDREVIGVSEGKGYSSIQEKNIEQDNRPYVDGLPYLKADRTLTKGTSEYEGWGTALKPAHEPICMARKPLAEKTVAENCLKWGTGGINIDESRVGTEELTYVGTFQRINKKNRVDGYRPHESKAIGNEQEKTVTGRFPANLIHDNSEEVRECFPDSNGMSGGGIRKAKSVILPSIQVKGDCNNDHLKRNDYGNASRFFKSIPQEIEITPAHEPICMARKPLAEKTVAENCLKWGTGGINIDESRVEYQGDADRASAMPGTTPHTSNKGKNAIIGGGIRPDHDLHNGRFPANLIHDNSEEVRDCFPDVKTGGRKIKTNCGNAWYKQNVDVVLPVDIDNGGNASRFFKSIIYTAKASKSERNKGCENLFILNKDTPEDIKNQIYKHLSASNINGIL